MGVVIVEQLFTRSFYVLSIPLPRRILSLFFSNLFFITRPFSASISQVYTMNTIDSHVNVIIMTEGPIEDTLDSGFDDIFNRHSPSFNDEVPMRFWDSSWDSRVLSPCETPSWEFPVDYHIEDEFQHCWNQFHGLTEYTIPENPPPSSRPIDPRLKPQPRWFESLRGNQDLPRVPSPPYIESRDVFCTTRVTSMERTSSSPIFFTPSDVDDGGPRKRKLNEDGTSTMKKSKKGHHSHVRRCQLPQSPKLFRRFS